MKEVYRELFDGVRASGRLRMEVMSMTKEERPAQRRRIPKAALVAAALVLALAGTALAAEVLGAISIRFLDGDGEDSAGYQILGDPGRFPVETFSEELLTWAADCPMGSSGDFSYGYRRFDSWEEAEAFLGVHLAENPAMALKYRGWIKTGSLEDFTSSHCEVSMAAQDDLPFRVSVDAVYRADCGDGKKKMVRVGATMFTEVFDDITSWCYEEGVLRDSDDLDGSTFETYTTPNGLEAVIVSEELEPHTWGFDGNELIDRVTIRRAYFIWNDVFYELYAEDETQEARGPDFGDEFEEIELNGFIKDPQAALRAMKHVLDGFQP